MQEEPAKTCRILALDGGGAKGFYTLGVLKQLEALLGGEPLATKFDLIFGTSTGAIASLLALGNSAKDIHALQRARAQNHGGAFQGAAHDSLGATREGRVRRPQIRRREDWNRDRRHQMA
ncbi:hypothetical protein CTP10_R64520 (plasmid) [Cupriavidus sp. P-10]|uniref:patatin-like phospholipase family protein n=1 Tax=Cupriavidus sp. P-10 TaxID=2027911 RepID=UPI000ED7851E|nr:hypothetical protein CTP10_R64520 [Cupriavidus sp. P-10]